MKAFAFILLLISVTSFYVYEKIPLNTYVAKVRRELKEIAAFHFIEELNFTDFDYTVGDEACTLSSVKAKAVFFNSFMPAASIENPTNLILKCSWTAPESGSYISPYHSIYRAELKYNNVSYPIEFEMEAKQFIFFKQWEKYAQDNFYFPAGSCQIEFVASNAKNLDEKSPFTQKLLLQVINAFISANNPNMNKALNNGINSYYKSLPFEELMQKIYTQTANVPYENNFDLTLEEMPEYGTTSQNEGYIIFKRKGTLNGEASGTGELPTDDTNIQRFNLHGRLYQKLITDNKFDIKFEQTNNPASMYQLTGLYLKQVANASINDTTQLRLEAKMGDITFNTQDPMLGEITLGISIISLDDLETVFAFSAKFTFMFVPTLFQSGLNFVLLSKNLQITDVAPETGFDIIDKVLLMEWVRNTYLCALGNNEYNLFELPMDLSYYFNTNDLSWEFLGYYLSVKKN